MVFEIFNQNLREKWEARTKAYPTIRGTQGVCLQVPAEPARSIEFLEEGISKLRPAGHRAPDAQRRYGSSMSNTAPPRRIESRPVPADRLKRPIFRFMAFAAAGGIVLLTVTLIALVWANSPAADSYHRIFERTQWSLMFGGFGWTAPALHWINDLLMAVFFFYIGLEIKRETLVGELRSLRKAAVPLFAAAGGMLVPAGIYALFNHSTDGAHGWGIPMATDIAFALGILALLGSRVPIGLKVFLTTLAVADDLGALIVIAVFYTDSPSLANLGLAFLALGAMFLMNRLGVRQPLYYLIAGGVVWWFIHHSGIHATIGGVLTALAIPVKRGVHAPQFATFVKQSAEDFDRSGIPGQNRILSPEQHSIVQGIEDACDKVQSPLQSLEHSLAPWVAFLIVPLFALANAGVAPAGSEGLWASATSRESIGIVLGLIIGKPLGIMLACFIAVKAGFGALPERTTWAMLHGAAWLAGIGFTMSLFIASLAFKGNPDSVERAASQLANAKIGVLAGSTIAATVGLLLLWYALKPSNAFQPNNAAKP